MRGRTVEVAVEVEADTAEAEADAAGLAIGMAEGGTAEGGVAAFEVAGSVVAIFMVLDLGFMGIHIRGGRGDGIITAIIPIMVTIMVMVMVTTTAPTPRPTVETLRSLTPHGQSRRHSHGEGSTAGVSTGSWVRKHAARFEISRDSKVCP
jgi:hypothetical protein